MNDVNDWFKKRRTIHDAAPRGAWETSSAERDAFYTLPALLTAVEKVLELHKPSEYGCVSECQEPNGDMVWPCPTVRAIEGAINE